MANRIRGKKRQEIIDNWIKGIEDPDVEVQPTKKENRYIVRPKVNKEEEEVKKQEEAVKEEEVVKKQSVKKPPVKKEPAKKPPKMKEPSDEYEPQSEYEYEYEYEEEPERNNTELLQYEILNELKRMNDEKASRRAEKQRQKELKDTVKYQMMKHFSQQQQINEPQQPQRRRLNLLKRII